MAHYFIHKYCSNRIFISQKSVSLFSLSGACHVEVAASVSWRHVDLSKVRRLAVARLKSSGRRSSLNVLNQVCLDQPVLHHQSLGGLRKWHDWCRHDKAGQIKTGSDICIWQEWLIRTRPNHVIRDKIRPVDMENTSNRHKTASLV